LLNSSCEERSNFLYRHGLKDCGEVRRKLLTASASWRNLLECPHGTRM